MRYLAKKGGLQGDTDTEYILSEMLFCEAEDLWCMLTKAMYSADKVKSFEALFASDGCVSPCVIRRLSARLMSGWRALSVGRLRSTQSIWRLSSPERARSSQRARSGLVGRTILPPCWTQLWS